MRLLSPCSDSPINGANIVTGLVDAHLIEIHPTSAQLRMVQADQLTAPMRAGKQGHFADSMTHVDQLGEAYPYAIAGP